MNLTKIIIAGVRNAEKAGKKYTYFSFSLDKEKEKMITSFLQRIAELLEVLEYNVYFTQTKTNITLNVDIK